MSAVCLCRLSSALVFVSCIASSVFAASAPAIFIFGDSLVDTGNNNYIMTLAKANVKFNGIDFGNGQPNGRFCNGQTVTDILAELIGLPPPPVFLDPTVRGTGLLQGVNYASGAAGILRSSGFSFIGRIPFDQQLFNFRDTIAELVSTVGQQHTSELISQSLYFVVFGSNDYINNYVLPTSPFHSYSPQQYEDMVVSTYIGQLTTLYQLGARKILVSTVGPLGCIPFEIAYSFNPNATCVSSINNLVLNFNAATHVAVDQLQAQFPDARIITANAYGVVERILANPAAYGFKYPNEACCGNGHLGGMLPCTPASKVCTDRADYVFWDAFHPSAHTNLIIANAFYSGTQDDISPFNVQQLVASS